MTPGPQVTPQTAVLRVLIAGPSDTADIIRKVRDWTDGRIELNELELEEAIHDLEDQGLLERQATTEKRSGQPRQTFALTASGHASAVQILAASLTGSL